MTLKRLWALALACLLIPIAAPHVARAQDTVYYTCPITLDTGVVTNGKCPVTPSSGLPATDANNAAFGGAVAMTPDTTYTARRSIGANCTVAGSVSLTFADASTLTVPVSVGWQTFPFAVTAVNTSGTTATCSYSNLK